MTGSVKRQRLKNSFGKGWIKVFSKGTSFVPFAIIFQFGETSYECGNSGELCSKRSGKGSRIILEWIEELVIAIVLIAVVFTFLFRIITVTGTSMIPNYNDGDRVLVVSNPLQISQGDVVVIINVLEEPIIKRVIATEGQTVDFDPESKAVLVNGQPVDETEFGLSNGMTDLPYTSFEILEFPQTVPEGCILFWEITVRYQRTAAIK